MKQSDVSALTPVPAVAGLRPYVPPQPNPLIDLPLHATERPVLSADLRSYSQAIDADSLHRYPDSRALEALLAARLGVPPSHLLVTAGADEAIDRACRAMLTHGRNLLTVTPTFEMIPVFARLTGAEVKTVPWPHGALPVEAMLQAATAQTSVIAVVTPNNPTGAIAHGDELRRLAAGVPHALLLVDMAYAEFADHDITEAVTSIPNAIMMRTLSKAWGLPGIRIGYSVAHPEIINWLRTVGGPYSVPRPSQALAHARLGSGEADMKVYVDRVRHERKQLEPLLRSLGAEVHPSQANYVLAHFSDATWVHQALGGLGIGVRAFPAVPELHNARRISCPGDDASFERLRGALMAVLAPQGLLLDLDGVIADVSQSYRQAIIATAAEFGVTLTAGAVAAAKAAGSANNDWQVTHRLLAEHDVHPTLEAVTECFERLYQGTRSTPGLRSHESLLCSVELLEALAKRLPLACVTGRPRADAERFFYEFGIAKVFKHAVCMEDAPLKPDPAPVRLALEKLGVQAAWMVGDTPDDIRAARGANVVPLGVVAPGDDAERTESVLYKAGAARVLTRLGELQELLR